jgi:L-threonylcarbamoyladenylate synthase
MRIFTSLTDPDLISMLQNGAVGVLPSDTLYGLVASSHDPRAVERLYALKHRERKPGTSIAGNIDQLLSLGLPRLLVERVAHLWPNPLSVEMHHDLAYIHDGTGRSSFRVVADPLLREFLLQTGPLTTSSANQPNELPATTIAEAQAYFGDQVDFYVDGGEIKDRAPSTVIGITEDGHITVFREGVIKVSEKGTII